MEKEKLVENLAKKNEKADEVKNYMKEILDLKQKEVRQEELKKYENAFSNRKKMKELEEMVNLNNAIKASCKDLVLKKYKN